MNERQSIIHWLAHKMNYEPETVHEKVAFYERQLEKVQYPA